MLTKLFLFQPPKSTLADILMVEATDEVDAVLTLEKNGVKVTKRCSFGEVETIIASAKAKKDVISVAELVLKAKAVVEIVEGKKGPPGSYRDYKSRRLKDTPEWCELYSAVKTVRS